LKFLSAQETPWVVRPNSTHRVAVLIAASQLLTATFRPAWRGWSTEARHRVGWGGGKLANLTIKPLGDRHSRVAIAGTLSDEMHRTHAHNRISAHHRMIVKDHLDIVQHHDEALGDLHVCSRGHWIAGRMIVR
jgi:hypothetical protein